MNRGKCMKCGAVRELGEIEGVSDKAKESSHRAETRTGNLIEDTGVAFP